VIKLSEIVFNSAQIEMLECNSNDENANRNDNYAEPFGVLSNLFFRQ